MNYGLNYTLNYGWVKNNINSIEFEDCSDNDNFETETKQYLFEDDKFYVKSVAVDEQDTDWKVIPTTSRLRQLLLMQDEVKKEFENYVENIIIREIQEGNIFNLLNWS